MTRLLDLIARLLPLHITFDVDPHHDAVLFWEYQFSLLGTRDAD